MERAPNLRARQLVEELQGFSVAPVEVVGREQERLPWREDHAGDGVEETLPLVTLRQRLRVREVGCLREELRSSRASSVRREGRRAQPPMTGPYASAPSVGYERASAITAPRWAHHKRNSSMSRVFPMPGSPVTRTNGARPHSAARHRVVRRVHSRTRPVAAGVVQPPEQPIRPLVKRLVAQAPLGVQDGLGIVPACLENFGETLQGLDVALEQPLALAEEPLVVAPFEEIA